MQALEEQYRTTTPPEICDRCYERGHSNGYELGLRDGAASVRKSPLIVVNWSTLTGGIINIIGFAALLFIAGWIGEMRGMNSDGRLNITFSDGQSVPEKTSAAPIIRGLNGTTVTIVPKD